MTTEIRSVSELLSNAKKLSSDDPESNVRNMQFMNNLEGCVVSAADVVAETRSIVSSRSSASGRISVQGDGLTESDAVRVQDWRSHVDNSTTSNPRMPTSRPVTASSTSSRLSTIHNHPQQQPRSNSQTTNPTSRPTTVSGNGNENNIQVVDDYDLEAVLIQQWHNRAVVQFAQHQYAAAEPYLRKTLSRSQSKYGAGFRGEGEMLRMLALSCAHQAKEENVIQIFDSVQYDFEWREMVLETLLAACFQQNTLHKVEKVATKYGIESRSIEAALPRLVSSYSAAEKWQLAESVVDRYLFQGRSKAICDMLLSCCGHRPGQTIALACSRSGRPPSFANSICCRERWDQSERLLEKYTPLPGMETVLESFILECINHNDILSAFSLIQRYPLFRGRNEIMMKCISFCTRKKQWNAAEMILQEFLKTETMDEFEEARLKSELAYIYVQKKEYEVAEKICLEALQIWKKSHGRFQSSFHDCLALCARIYLEKGDLVEAEGYEDLLPRKYQGWCILKVLLTAECLQYAKWALELGDKSEREKEMIAVIRTLAPKEPLPAYRLSSWVTDWNCSTADKKENSLMQSLFGKGDVAWTLLHGFAATGNEMAVSLLLHSGYTVNRRDIDGRTPLHIAALYGHEATVQVLMEDDAEVDLKDDSGKTALFFAVAGNRKRCVQILLANGADPLVIDRNGNWAGSFCSDPAINDLLGPSPPNLLQYKVALRKVTPVISQQALEPLLRHQKEKNTVSSLARLI